MMAVEKLREQLHTRAPCRDDAILKSLLKSVDAGEGIEVKENWKPHAREWHRKAVGQPLLRGHLYETTIVFIAALQQDFDSLTQGLFGLRVIGFDVSLRYFREPHPNTGNEKRRYNGRRVANVLKENRVHVRVDRLAQGKGQFLSKNAIHGRRMLDGKAFEPGRKAVMLNGCI